MRNKLGKSRGNPPLGFIVQSDFPEGLHWRYVERYLEKLAARSGSPYRLLILDTLFSTTNPIAALLISEGSET